ncbi:HAD family hydrolase [Paenibacillus harenae]|uniref:HAD superfamily hydrolase (TIGR01509 family) n=1 Tax=Paenibacillus harenae TaxID=306543 RepID=A0ABT9TYC1_PAEHA|nr:HAD family hydrolase [Paenibacillus harenae]MDQ0112370.1 HAD superfamily hydrolase (TIGR01509 family) [Paenibacillus harenae]
MIKALIFDFDGTIIDTETPWYFAFQEVYGNYGLELPLALWGKCIGTTFAEFDPYEYLEQCLNRPIDRDDITTRSKEYYKKHMDKQELREGVREYLSLAKHKGLRIAIASSSSLGWIQRYLEKYELVDSFDIIVARDHVGQVKPSPELYLKAIELLGIEPTEAIAIEDSLNGLKAAKAAGLYCVVTPNDVTKTMNFENHDVRVDSLNQLSLDRLLATFR